MDGMYALQEPEAAAEQTILCCECGTTIQPNPVALCVSCLRARVDITEGIPKQGTIFFCKSCERYLSPPSSWVLAALESRELLALCLKRLKGLSKVRLIDAGFIWTEPHSKRIQVKLSIQKEAFAGTILQQDFVVTYTVQNQMCDDCHRKEAQDTWKALVQVRQRVKHKKTFFYLEQLIIKHSAHARTTKIQSCSDGIDFYYASKNDAKRMVDFLNAVVPMRYNISERLISQDIHTSTYNFKYSYSVEIVPVCKDELVCLPPSTAKYCGTISPILLCYKVGTTLHFLNPYTLQAAELPTMRYWRDPFNALATASQLTEYIVLDIEPLTDGGSPIQFGKFLLSEAIVARVRDFGVNDVQFTVRTHLGHILQPGDNAYGYDLLNSNFNDEYANKLDMSQFPEVFLVKKSYSEKRKAKKNRNWKLKFLNKDAETNPTKREVEIQEQLFESFLNDLEEDKELRSNVSIFKAEHAVVQPVEDEDDAQLEIGVDEMLDDFDAMQLDNPTVQPDAIDDDDDDEL